jgi:hypothetical protein
MTFNNAIPQSNDLISQSQSQILTNFSQLYTVFAQDHIEYDDSTSADRGKHKQVTLKELAAGPTTTATEIAIYTKAVSGTTRVFYREPSSGTEVQMTGPITAAQDGTCLLASGIKIVWGRDTIASGTATKAVTFVSAFGAAPYSVVATPYATPITGSSPREFGIQNATIAVGGFTAQSFNGNVPANVPFGYYAIGPA